MNALQTALFGFLATTIYTASLLTFPGFAILVALVLLGFDPYVTMLFILQGAVLFGTALGIRSTYILSKKMGPS